MRAVYYFDLEKAKALTAEHRPRQVRVYCDAFPFGLSIYETGRWIEKMVEKVINRENSQKVIVLIDGLHIRCDITQILAS